MLDVAEFSPGEISQLVRVAIPAGQRIPQQRGGEIARNLRNGADEVVVIRLRGNRYDCVVPKTIGTGRQRHATNAIPVTVDEFLRREVIAQCQRFDEHSVLGVGTKPHVKEQRRCACHLVHEAATHTQSDIEVRRNVRCRHLA